MIENEPKILFIHNSLLWYRTPFFKELNRICNVKFLFTKVISSNREYKNINTNRKDIEDLDYEITKNYLRISWKSLHYVLVSNYDIVLVTVLDDKYQRFESILCCIIAKIRGKKIAYFWERWEAPIDKTPWKKNADNFFVGLLFKVVLLFSDSNIVPGKKSKTYFLNNGANPNKITIAPDASEVIDNGVYINIKKKYNIQDSSKIILYFGRIMEIKGLDVLIKAYSKLENDFNNVFLLICGDGEFRNECEILSNNLKIKNIIFIGVVQPDIRASFFKQCNLFVLPSIIYNGRVDAWGLTVNEIMQFGKPVICTDAVGCAEDLIINNYNGFVIKENDEDDLYTAMTKVFAEGNKEIEMGKNSLKIISKFRYADMALGFKNAFYLPFKK